MTIQQELEDEIMTLKCQIKALKMNLKDGELLLKAQERKLEKKQALYFRMAARPLEQPEPDTDRAWSEQDDVFDPDFTDVFSQEVH